MSPDTTLVFVVIVALFFDFTNGFHDTANAIATSVSTRAISPRLAVLGAAVLNFAGAFLSLEVAATIAKGIVDPGAITLSIVLAGLVGAIAWNLVTWFLGLPSSSSHALVGGVIGSSVAATGGFAVVKWHGLVEKVVTPSLLAPLLAVPAAVLLTLLVVLIVRRRAPGSVNRVFRRLQLVSAGFVSLTHGTNDAQKTMGIITLALVTTGHVSTASFHVPTWVIVSSASAMALGTYVGGWRIIRTLGQRVTKLEPTHGFAAEAATASVLYVTARFGFPVSTTHTISSAILGAGATTRFSAVRWGIAGNIVLAWLLTLPAAALAGAGVQRLTTLPHGDAYALAAAVVIGAAAMGARRRQTRPATG
ncbi:MAG TPA: inorganic phosphate transporter [Mycobacteriales bacterium]|nr:inorganic phosphate transporter [Mycobacteriales bacterium]